MVGAEGIEPSTYAGYGFYRAARTIATSLPKIGCAGQVLHLSCYSLWNCCWSTPVHRASKIKKKEYFTKPYTAGNTRNLCKALPVTSVRIHRTAFIWVLSHALFNVHSSTQQKTPLRKSVTGFTNSDSTSPVTLKPFFDTLDGIDTGLGVLIIIKTRHWLWCKWMLHLNYLPSLLCFFKFILQ